ncbi:hypothetical protein BJ508DRAFT_333733 [Ascobolus immersus RN42]|uniref:Peptidase S33 tripeptidyl aminopeptidase-like C-terminal domain-containing protein n=1 Tax=Ascobolus immersus RN42 TaxID=1160509 RepID=A0A3N4HKG6_ASCIM|nr:hypothetical protein BJ508DRAFT_333733 [Ascobolus immersus RN42]
MHFKSMSMNYERCLLVLYLLLFFFPKGGITPEAFGDNDDTPVDPQSPEFLLDFQLRHRLFDSVEASTTANPKSISCLELLEPFRAAAANLKIELPPIPPTALCGRILQPIYAKSSNRLPVAYITVAYSYIPAKRCITVPGTVCDGPFLRARGGPGISAIKHLWSDWKLLQHMNPDVDWVAFDQRTVGYSSLSWAICGTDAVNGAEIISTAYSSLSSKHFPPDKRSTRQKGFLEEAMQIAKEYAQICKDSFANFPLLLQNMGAVSAADDAVAVLDSAMAWDYASRIDRLLVDSGTDLLSSLNYTKSYIEAGSDVEVGLLHFAAYCAQNSACPIRKKLPRIRAASPHSILRIIGAVFHADRYEDGCGLHDLIAEFVSAMIDPFNLYHDLANRIGKCYQALLPRRVAISRTSDVLWTAPVHRRFNFDTYGRTQGTSLVRMGAVELQNLHLIRCVDAETFGVGTDTTSLLAALHAASAISPLSAHHRILPWLLCAEFSKEMKSATVPDVDGLNLRSPALFISNERDPTTPSSLMKIAAARFPGSRHIYQRGILGHTVIGDGFPAGGKLTTCMKKIVTDYLRKGLLPDVGFCAEEKPPIFSLPFAATTPLISPFVLEPEEPRPLLEILLPEAPHLGIHN